MELLLSFKVQYQPLRTTALRSPTAHRVLPGSSTVARPPSLILAPPPPPHFIHPERGQVRGEGVARRPLTRTFG